MNERYYVFKNGAKLGPFTLHGLLEEIEAERADYEDLCLRIGSDTCEKLREVLDWEDHDISFSTETTPGASADQTHEPANDQIEENYDDDIDGTNQSPLSRPPRDSTAILYSGRPSVLSYPNSLLLITISLALGICFRSQYDWALLAGLCLALLVSMQMQLRRTRHQYYITPKQIELMQGLILINSREIPIAHIGAIHIRQRGFQGLLGIANIEFASLESPMPILVFHNIRAPRRIKDLIRRLQDALEYED